MEFIQLFKVKVPDLQVYLLSLYSGEVDELWEKVVQVSQQKNFEHKEYGQRKKMRGDNILFKKSLACKFLTSGKFIFCESLISRRNFMEYVQSFEIFF